MLLEINVKNLALIEAEKLNFGSALNILTGETGAGKSLIVGAISLLLGRRSNSDTIRDGCEEAEVSAFFDITDRDDLQDLWEKTGLEKSDKLIVRRHLSRSGRGKAYLNDTLVTLAQLSNFTTRLITISSQHEQQSLLEPIQQLLFLDLFSGNDEILAEMKNIWQDYQKIDLKCAAISKNLADINERGDLYEFQLNEIKEASLKKNEDEKLKIELEKLKSGAKIKDVISKAYENLYSGSGAALEKLAQVREYLEKASADNEKLVKLSKSVENSFLELNEVAFELSSYSQDLEVDSYYIDQLEERLDFLHKLKRKHNTAYLDEVIKKGLEIEEKLSFLEDGRAELSFLEKEKKDIYLKVLEKASVLSDLRKKTAKILAKKITESLHPLGLSNVEFEVKVSSHESLEKLGPLGFDTVKFNFSPNVGEPLRSIAKIASGGELSRVMLALKALLAGRQPSMTMVLDEIDAGIGGITAEKVAQKIEELAQDNQIICITHLPQIASSPGEHFLVNKEVRSERTITNLKKLNLIERVDELARMMFGENPTAEAKTTVKQMMAR